MSEPTNQEERAQSRRHPIEKSSEFETATNLLISLKRQAPEIPVQKRLKTDARADLVSRCAEFTSALKIVHPPGSPVFTVFQKFVLAQRQGMDHKRIILQLVELLKPTPDLLKKFCALLPRWCFNSSRLDTKDDDASVDTTRDPPPRDTPEADDDDESHTK